MAKHLKFDMIIAYQVGQIEHPQKVMEKLKITYQHSTPQTIGDQWWFWNCENIPDPLPCFLEILDIDPMEYIGWGLMKDEAEMIRDYKKIIK